MGWFTRLEQTVAGKLKEAFTDAKKLSTEAIDDVASAEQALQDAKQRAAKFTKAAHLAALSAATKAQAEAAALFEAAKEAEELANYHNGQINDTF
jgi:MFS superfamily sulfate permease-like transporter